MVKNNRPIQGHSSIPMSKNTEISLDDLTLSLGMEEWNLVAMESIITEDGEKNGINIQLQFLRKSQDPVNIFKISELK